MESLFKNNSTYKVNKLFMNFNYKILLKFAKNSIKITQFDWFLIQNLKIIKKARLNNLSAGFYEYVPIIFDENNFCLTTTTLHSILVEFKFKYNEIQLGILE
jgi:hypothetical protein